MEIDMTALRMVENEKGVSLETLVDAIEEALLKQASACGERQGRKSFVQAPSRSSMRLPSSSQPPSSIHVV